MNKNEIFRHIRPLWFNKSRNTLDTAPNGGISFLFLPSETHGNFNYWIYVCPNDALFSSKTAVNKLRAAVKNKTKPWGNISLSDDSILDTAVESILMKSSGLETQVPNQLSEILVTKFRAEYLHYQHNKSITGAAEFYEQER